MKKYSFLIIVLITLSSFIQTSAEDFVGSKTTAVLIYPNQGSPYFGYDVLHTIGKNYYNPPGESRVARTMYTFDLRSIPTNAQITNVSLSYTTTDYQNQFDFNITQIEHYTAPDEIWYEVGDASVLFSQTTYGNGSLSSSNLTNLVNAGKAGYAYLGAYTRYEGSENSYAILSLTLNVTYTVPPTVVTITADNNFTAWGGSNHGSMTIDGSPQTIPLTGYPITKNTGQSVSLSAVSNQTNSQGHQMIWNTSSCIPSNWTRNNEPRSTNQTYSFNVTADDNGKKYTANFYPNYATTSGTMAASENWISSVTLSGSNDVIVPAGVTLTITSCASVNLNGRSIISTGGTIISQGSVNGLKAELKKNSVLKGLCGTVQAAVNAVAAQDYGNIYDIELKYGNIPETINITNKYNTTFHGNGYNTISGYLNVSNCESCSFYGFRTPSMTMSSCTGPSTNLSDINFTGGRGNECLYIYNTPNFYYSGGDVTHTYGTGFNFNSCSNASIGSSAFENSSNGVRGSSSTVNIYNAGFCGNTYDLVANSGATVTAHYCWFHDAIARTSGAGATSEYPYNDQGCLAKKNAGIAKTLEEVSDSPEKEFIEISNKNFDLAKKERDDIAQNKYTKDKYQADYLKVADSYKEFISKHSGSAYAKTALMSTVHIYRQLKDYVSMNNFLQSILKERKFESESGLAKRYMIEYYKHQKDYSTAIKTADEILSSLKGYEDEIDLICEALYAKGMIYNYELKEPAKAVECFSSIVQNYSDNSLVTLAEAELSILGVTVQRGNKKAEEKETAKITEFSTSNHPNPFNPSTTIKYNLPQEGKVAIRIYDILGRELVTLVNDYKQAGSYSVLWNGKDGFGSEVASGVYFYNIRYNDNSITKKMMLVR